jgi:hypothetical protein
LQKILVLVQSQLAQVLLKCYSCCGHRVFPFLNWCMRPSRNHTMTLLSIAFYTTI